jgi:hypothetical protein
MPLIMVMVAHGRRQVMGLRGTMDKDRVTAKISNSLLGEVPLMMLCLPVSNHTLLILGIGEMERTIQIHDTTVLAPVEGIMREEKGITEEEDIGRRDMNHAKIVTTEEIEEGRLITIGEEQDLRLNPIMAKTTIGTLILTRGIANLIVDMAHPQKIVETWKGAMIPIIITIT